MKEEEEGVEKANFRLFINDCSLKVVADWNFCDLWFLSLR